MKIALVGPGLAPIPPQGWGAIEILIWKHYQAFTKAGHEVTIFNSKNLPEVVVAINTTDFDFVHVHYDEFAHYFSRHCRKPFCITSHYGYILKRERWARGYFSIFADFLATPGIIALAPAIKDLYKKNGYEGPLYVLKNGIDVKLFNFVTEGNGKVLCLGKIEPRKQQAQLARILEGSVSVDFVGPLADSDFSAGKTAQYKGVWTKEEVQKNLTNYSTLVLLSAGEAAPLVVIEALAAGVSVVISKSAAANLDNKSFITVIDDDLSDTPTIISALKNAVQKNTSLRNEIRAYATDYFDNEPIMKEYFSLIQDFQLQTKNRLTKKKAFHVFVKDNYVAYVTSRSWLVLSQLPLLRKGRDFLRKMLQ
jgi:glycosyltransferase involved in cell wall biosynthesis